MVLAVAGGGSFPGMAGVETIETINAFIDQTGTTFQYLWDADPTTLNAFAFQPSQSPYPRQVLLGRNGEIRYVNVEYDIESLRGAITAALADS